MSRDLLPNIPSELDFVSPEEEEITDSVANSIQKDGGINIAYQSLEDKENPLYIFLKENNVDSHDMKEMRISGIYLDRLFNKEMSSTSWLKWASIDHAFEKIFQALLFCNDDIALDAKEKNRCRAYPQERSILLASDKGLMKAYIARGFVNGVKTGLFKSVHYFIYCMLLYRAFELMNTGHIQFLELEDIFNNSSQKGIDSLVHILAHIEAKWLYTISAIPLFLGVGQALWSLRKVPLISEEEFLKITDETELYLSSNNSWWQDFGREIIPILSNVISLTSKLQRLERLVRMDGRLLLKTRRAAFELIRRVAKEGNRLTQINALESLAKIAHGIGLKDLPRLQQAGYGKEEILFILYAKATSLSDLEELCYRDLSSERFRDSWEITKWVAPVPRKIYANYKVWWLGQSIHSLQKLIFPLIKVITISLEFLFLQKIVTSIIEAINCPNEAGFKFGDGSADWASDYSAECFTARLGLFRGINPNDSVAELIAEIPQYHLSELTTLYLSYKYLNDTEAYELIQAVMKQHPPLNALYLNNNKLANLSSNFFEGLNQLQVLSLDDNQIEMINPGVLTALTKLQTLYLYANRLTYLADGVFLNLNQLRLLYLYGNQINNISAGAFEGLTTLQTLELWNNSLSSFNDGMWASLPKLQSLRIQGNQINASVLISLLPELPPTLTTLDFSRNNIDNLPEDFLSILPLNIHSLTIGGGFVPTTLNAEFMARFFRSNFTGVGVCGSHIINIAEDAFSEFSALQFLNLAYNNMTDTSLSSKVFATLTQVQTLYMNNNLITRFPPGIFSNFKKLQTLTLRYNQLKKLDNNLFSNLTELINLYVDFSPLSELELGAFANLNKLQYLWLGSNHLTALDLGIFSNLTQLQGLYLQNNLLSNFSVGVLSSLGNIQELWMQNNRLSDESIANLTIDFPNQLSALYLADNQIGDNGAQILVNLLPCTNIESFSFDNNPINDSSVILSVQESALKKFCDDQRCHANLPSTEICSSSENNILIFSEVPADEFDAFDFVRRRGYSEISMLKDQDFYFKDFNQNLLTSRGTAREIMPNFLLNIFLLGIVGICIFILFKNFSGSRNKFKEKPFLSKNSQTLLNSKKRSDFTDIPCDRQRAILN